MVTYHRADQIPIAIPKASKCQLRFLTARWSFEHIDWCTWPRISPPCAVFHVEHTRPDAPPEADQRWTRARWPATVVLGRLGARGVQRPSSKRKRVPAAFHSRPRGTPHRTSPATRTPAPDRLCVSLIVLKREFGTNVQNLWRTRPRATWSSLTVVTLAAVARRSNPSRASRRHQRKSRSQPAGSTYALPHIRLALGPQHL